MGFFNKGKKAAEAKTDAVSTKSAPRKRKKDRLDSVIAESVIDNVLDDFRAAEVLEVTYDQDGSDRKMYVGALLDVNDESIGGMGASTKKDESKGSVIEMMNSRKIKIYASRALLDEDKLIIIPDADSMEAADEFGLLREANYKLVLVDPEDGSVVYPKELNFGLDEKEHVDFEVFQQISEGKIDPQRIISMDQAHDSFEDELYDSSDETRYNDEEEDEVFDEVGEDIEDDFAGYEDEEAGTSEYGEGEYDEDLAMSDYDDGMDEEAVEGFDDLPLDEDIEEDGEYEDEEEDETIEVDEETYREHYVRRFYSPDLELEVSSEPFDVEFMEAPEPVYFDEDRGEGWINSYLNELSREANLQLRSLHEQNLTKLRSHYFAKLSERVAQVQEEMDWHDNQSHYGKQVETLQQEHEKRLEHVNRVIEDAKALAAKEFDDEAKAHAHAVAVAAENEYREQHRQEHHDKLAAIESDKRRSIENLYEKQLKQIATSRSSQAKQDIDTEIDDLLAGIREVYGKMLNQENKVRAYWSKKIQDYLTKNREKDVAHTRVLQQELEQSEKADRVLSEYQKKLSAQSEEHKLERERMVREMERVRASADQMIELAKKEADNRVRQMQQEREGMQHRLDSVMEKYTNLDRNKEEQFAHRLAVAEDQRASWENKFNELARSQRKSNAMGVGLTISAVIAALAIGVMSGFFVNGKLAENAGTAPAPANVQQVIPVQPVQPVQPYAPQQAPQVQQQAPQQTPVPAQQAPTPAPTPAPGPAPAPAQQGQ